MKINFTLKRTKNFNNICVAALNRQKETDGQGDRQAGRQAGKQTGRRETSRKLPGWDKRPAATATALCICGAALRVAHSSIYGTLRLKTKLKFNK